MSVFMIVFDRERCCLSICIGRGSVVQHLSVCAHDERIQPGHVRRTNEPM